MQVIYELFPFFTQFTSLSISQLMYLTSDRHVGDSNVKCMCPYGYRGNKCETHEFLDEENGELSVLILSQPCPKRRLLFTQHRM